MVHFVCEICGYAYDPTVGEAERDVLLNTDFEDLPIDWTCPVCGASKDDFSEEFLEEDGEDY